MLSECDSAESWESGAVAWDRSSALNKPCYSRRAQLSSRCHCGWGSRGRCVGPWVSSPLWKRCLLGALSLRYRSSATFPLAFCSSSSLRFCLWKKPSWVGERSHTESVGQGEMLELNQFNYYATYTCSYSAFISIKFKPDLGRFKFVDVLSMLIY